MKQKLFSYCSSLRDILEKCRNDNKDLFESFPNAYCADASLWLCDYLISKGFEEKLFRFRSKDPFLDDMDGNHVWLHYCGFNLDITADQFNEDGYNFPSVIVTNIDSHYNLYDEDFYKKEYSLHSMSPSCMFERWDERYDIVYKQMGIEFDMKSIAMAH